MARLENLDQESEVIQQYRNSWSEQSNENFFKLRKEIFPDAFTGIAEGDSWFDYPPAWASDISLGDLINQLNNRGTLNVFRIAKGGDTLENMTFGTNINPMVKNLQLERTLELIKKYQPEFFLFSGTGNDVAGTNGVNFEPFLHHSKSNLSSTFIKEDYLNFVVNSVFYEMFIYLIEQVIAIKSDIQIFLHGYSYPIPDGRAVIEIGNYEFIGPWLQPALRRKGLSTEQGMVILHILIDRLNEMLSMLANAYPRNVHYINLREIINDGDWENELHLSALGFKKVADEFKRRILQVLRS